MAFRNFAAGIAATFAAGPIFVTSLALAQPVLYPDPITLPLLEIVTAVLPIFAVASVAGAIIAAIPIAIGATAMGWLGEYNAGLRLPPAWGLTGGMMSGGWFVFVPSESTEHGVIFALVATGAICALICRYGTRWSDCTTSAVTTPEAINACPAK
jgi:hypothetical protein